MQPLCLFWHSTQAVDGPDDLKPIAYISSSFSKTLQRWPATEKEGFADYQSVLKFDIHLRGAQYHVVIINQLNNFVMRNEKI